MAEIYWLLEPDTRKVRYVGCAADSAKRVRSHWRQRNSTGRNPVKDWLQSLSQPPEFEVIQVVSNEQAQAAETYWIKLIRETSVGSDLLNVLDGRKMRPETRQKIAMNRRNPAKKRSFSDQAKENIRKGAILGAYKGWQTRRRNAGGDSAGEEVTLIK